MPPLLLDLMLDINNMANAALDRAEENIKAAQAILNDITGGETE